MADFRRLYNENFEEYKKLLKLFVETKAKINIHCGCTEADEAKLKYDYETARRE